MADLFSLCIHPSTATGEFDQWRQLHAFGEPLPDWSAGDPDALLFYSLLEVAQPEESALYAAVEGKLSIQPPDGFLQALDLEGEDFEDSASDPAMTLYLTPGLSKLNPDFAAAMGPFVPATLHQQQPDVRPLLGIDTLTCFVYLNVDTISVQEIVSPGLQTLLDKASLSSKEKRKKKRLQKRWLRFLSGRRSRKVSLGEHIGDAGEPYAPVSASGARQTGFGIVTKYGVHDPGRFYQRVRDHVHADDPAWINKLHDDVFGVNWPLIPDNADPATIGMDTLYPYTALLNYKNAAQLSYNEWRSIGNRQKTLYLQRLLRRVRPDLMGGSGPPRFQFNMDDSRNLFQLEAIAEYFINDPDPWDINANPAVPGDDRYQPVEFTSLYGTSATANGAIVTLNDAQDLERVTVGLDILVLDADTAEPTKQYRIVRVNETEKKVTLDRTPTLATPSKWYIRHNPQLVLIDAFGARIRGKKAVPTDTPYEIQLADLDGIALDRLRKTNSNFDTIDLDIPGSDARVFRILDKTVNTGSDNVVLTVDFGTAHIPDTGVPWKIPAGVGGQRDASVSWPKSAAKSSKSWWDHYDGLMFVVVGGRVERAIPWSSYTSRADDAYLTSVRGNRRYIIHSYLSPKHSFIFKVTDADSHLTGNAATRAGTDSKGRPIYTLDTPLAGTLLKKSFDKTARKPSARYKRITFYDEADQPFKRSTHIVKKVDEAANQVTLSKNSSAPAGPSAWRIILYDGVHEARDYFSGAVTPDTAAADQVPPYGSNQLGKGFIRLHTGYLNKNGSQGCLVSRQYYKLRNILAQAHMEDYAYYYQAEPQKRLLEGTQSIHKHPPEGRRLESINRRILEQKKNKQRWERLLSEFESVSQSGIPILEPLQAELIALVDSFGETEGDVGDDLGAEEISRLYGEILGLLDRDEIKTIMAADEATLEALDPLKAAMAEIKQLQAQRTAEQNKLGWWNQIILADLWLIRPDERPEA
jgi:hypothetical protein